MSQTIYRYTNDFDKDVICDKIANIEEQIQDEIGQKATQERDKKIRELMYAQLIQGLRLCTGYNYFYNINLNKIIKC